MKYTHVFVDRLTHDDARLSPILTFCRPLLEKHITIDGECFFDVLSEAPRKPPTESAIVWLHIGFSSTQSEEAMKFGAKVVEQCGEAKAVVFVSQVPNSDNCVTGKNCFLLDLNISEEGSEIFLEALCATDPMDVIRDKMISLARD